MQALPLRRAVQAHRLLRRVRRQPGQDGEALQPEAPDQEGQPRAGSARPGVAVRAARAVRGWLEAFKDPAAPAAHRNPEERLRAPSEPGRPDGQVHQAVRAVQGGLQFLKFRLSYRLI